MVIKEALQFEQNLYNLINTCGLPVDTAYYIFKSVFLTFQRTLLNCAEHEGEVYTQDVIHAEGQDAEKILTQIVQE